MNILMLLGSARENGNTAALADACARGARESGCAVDVLNVARLHIEGCRGCNLCQTGNGRRCVIADDQFRVYEAMTKADALVIASPIYFFMLSAQIEAAIQRMHATGMPRSLQAAGLILTAGSSGSFDAAQRQHRMIFNDYLGVRDCGMVTASGAENKSPRKQQEAQELGRRFTRLADQP